MSRRGSPYENARAERFVRTLKEEEVQGRSYENVDNVKLRIGEFLEEIYNRQRLHSALYYLTPDEFEQSLKTVENQRQVSHRFHRPWKSLRDSHTSHRPDTTDVNTITKTACYRFFFRDFVSTEGCSAQGYVCLRYNLLPMSPGWTNLIWLLR
jgi:hypothetical protein